MKREDFGKKFYYIIKMYRNKVFINKTKKIIKTGLLVFLILYCFCSLLLFYKLIKYKRIFDERIRILSEQVLELRTVNDPYKKVSVEYSTNGFNYFALGNSITIHESVSYWPFDDRGMAASTINNDYVHLVNDYLKSKYDNVKSYSYNFFTWETMYYDRAEVLPLIDSFLSDKLNLVTIQLGENVSNVDTFYNDLIDLAQYVKSKASKAEIIMIDNFWQNDNISEIKKNVAKDLDLKYIDLSSIKNNIDYKCGVGTIINSDNGGGENLWLNILVLQIIQGIKLLSI